MPRMSKRVAWIPLVFLILLSSSVMFLDLGRNGLHNQDEARHAVVAREAALEGRWLPLTYLGSPYYNKPPLRIWLTAATFKLIGIHETSVRLWSALSGLGTIVMLYLVGRRLWGERVAFLSGLILLTSHQYLYNHCVRTGETDALLIFCWTSALLLLQLSVEERRSRLLYLAAMFVGLCGLVKHLGFVPILLVIAVGYLALSGGWRAFSRRTWATGLGTALAVPAPWHLWMWLSEGQPFLHQYFLGEVIEERLEASGGGPRQLPTGPWASLATLARGFFPWSSLLPFAVAAVPFGAEWRRRWSMPLLWLFIAMATTVASGRKFSWYVLPAFPAAAILVAALLDRFLEMSGSVWLRAGVVLGGVAALLSSTNAATHNPFGSLAREAMLGVHLLGRVRGPNTGLVAATALAIVLAGLLGLIHAGLRRARHAGGLRQLFRALLVVSLTGLGLSTVLVPLRFSRTTTPLREISKAVDAHLPAGETLNVALPRRKRAHPRFQFYLGEHDLRVGRIEEILNEESAGQLLLTDAASVESIRQRRPDLAPSHPPIAQARGLLLLRIPGE